MKKIVFTLFLCLPTIILYAQDIQKKEIEEAPVELKIDSTKVYSLDSTIETLYNVISAEKDIERNWKLFNYLFESNAKLIPSGKNKYGEYKIRYLSPTDYINSSGSWMKENGFIEKEINRKVETFGNIAHVFSTYEAFTSNTDKKPFMRGINSIQLYNDGDRWWIINVYWTQETQKNPIPKKYQ